MTTRVLHASTTRHAEWRGGARYVRIVLHDTQEELQVAAQRYRGGGDEWTGVAGCFHPAPDRETYDGHQWTRTTPKGWAGVMRLARAHLNPEVVIHESVHAALTIYRMDVATYVQLGHGCGHREETLAYIIGDLSTEIIGTLVLAGEWSDTSVDPGR